MDSVWSGLLIAIVTLIIIGAIMTALWCAGDREREHKEEKERWLDYLRYGQHLQKPDWDALEKRVEERRKEIEDGREREKQQVEIAKKDREDYLKRQEEEKAAERTPTGRMKTTVKVILAMAAFVTLPVAAMSNDWRLWTLFGVLATLWFVVKAKLGDSY